MNQEEHQATEVEDIVVEGEGMAVPLITTTISSSSSSSNSSMECIRITGDILMKGRGKLYLNA